MNRELKENLRCPWCGRIAPPPAQVYFTTRECVCCGNRYGWSWDMKAVLAEFSGIALIFIDLWLLINGYYAVFILITALTIAFYPSKYYVRTYKRADDSKAETSVYNIRVTGCEDGLKENMIYPICLGKERSGCVFAVIHSVKKKDSVIIAELHTLPCSEGSIKADENEVHIYLGDREICTGEII